jgi:hypothetical protein
VYEVKTWFQAFAFSNSELVPLHLGVNPNLRYAKAMLMAGDDGVDGAAARAAGATSPAAAAAMAAEAKAYTVSASEVLLRVERALGAYYARSALLTLVATDQAAAAALSSDGLRRAVQPLFTGVSNRPGDSVGHRSGGGTGAALPPCREIIAIPPVPPTGATGAVVTPVGAGGGVRDKLDAALAAWIHASPSPERLVSLAGAYDRPL